jgi:cell division septal protein FtsQ
VAKARQAALARARTHANSRVVNVLPSGRSLAIGFGLLAAAFLLYIGARETSVFAVRSIDVATEPAGHARPVATALKPLEGRSLLKLDEASIAAQLGSLPYVHLVGYDRAFPSQLRVRVTVERPVAVLRRADENWLVSEEGRVLRKLQRRLRRPLPVVWIPSTVEPEIGAILRTPGAVFAVAALAEIRTADPTFARRIWSVSTEDNGVTLVLRDRFELRLGSPSELALKIAVARRVLASLRFAGTDAAYADLSVPDRPVVGTSLDSQVEP